MSWLERLRSGLSKTRAQINETAGFMGNDVKDVFTNRLDTIEDLEYALIAADVGRAATEEILEDVRRSEGKNMQQALMDALTLQLEPNARRAEFRKLGFAPQASRVSVQPNGHVVMVIGVNGVGKTTTIAKLGQYYMGRGQTVMFAAGDTFRAAAGAQLGEWGDRLGVPVVQGTDGGDPAAVAYDAATARAARGTDLLFVDTAGRLHNKHNLMEELKKVRRVIEGRSRQAGRGVAGAGRRDRAERPAAGQEVPRVHAPDRRDRRKLDGTAKGGILVPIVRELGVPIKFIGVGESAGDLQPFDSQEFVRALFDVDVPKG